MYINTNDILNVEDLNFNFINLEQRLKNLENMFYGKQMFRAFSNKQLIKIMEDAETVLSERKVEDL